MKQKIIAIALGILVLCGGGFFIAQDRTPPEIITTPQTVSYDAKVQLADLASATDNRSENVLMKVIDVSPGTAQISETGDSIYFPDVGEYTVTVSAKDSAENETVSTVDVAVLDSVKPKITALKSQVTIEYAKELTVEETTKDNSLGAVIEDKTETEIVITSVRTGQQEASKDAYNMAKNKASLSFNKLGTYTVEFRVTDAYDNFVTGSAQVEVIDAVQPVIKVDESNLHLADNETNWDWLKGVTATDEVDGDLTKSISVDASGVKYGVPGKYQVLYQVKDLSGNQATFTRSITVDDTTQPVLTIPYTSFDLTTEDGKPTYLSGVTANDTVDGDLTASVKVDDSKVNYQKPGTYEVTYQITDKAGNVSRKSVSVNITAPASQASGGGEAESTGSAGGIVLITRTGECYHTHACGRGTYYEATLAEAQRRGLRPCQKCYS